MPDLVPPEYLYLRSHIKRRVFELGHIGLRKMTFNPAKLLDTDLAYAAALVDGEGSVGIGGIAVTSTCQEVIEWMHGKFGGTVREINQKSPLSKKRAWGWYLHRIRDLRVFLLLIIPWMIIKREKANAVLVYTERRITIQREEPL
jgi:hypothetical protein